MGVCLCEAAPFLWGVVLLVVFLFFLWACVGLSTVFVWRV